MYCTYIYIYAFVCMTRHRQRVSQRQTWMWAAGICTGIMGSLPYTPCSWSVVHPVFMSLSRLTRLDRLYLVVCNVVYPVFMPSNYVNNFVKQWANKK